MAGSSMTFAYHEMGAFRKVVATWTSDDTTGAVSGSTKPIRGRLVKAITNPGSPAPTANYDIAITDDNSFDVLAGVQSSLANRHTSTTEEVYFLVLDAAGTPLAQSIHPVVCDALTIAITNAGNSKQGTISLFYEVGIGKGGVT